MIEQPLISVLMTAYNREAYVAEAIESVLASAYQNWELIIVDDGSKDDTAAIAKSFETKDKRIRVYTNNKNLGDYPNRNIAACYAKGKYLKYLDSDDTINPGALAVMVEMMEKNPGAGWGISNFFETQELINYPVNLSAKEAYEYHYFKHPIFFASPGLAIFRKEAFDSAGGFLEKRMVSDFDMWHKIAVRYPLLLLPGNLIKIREHAGREMAAQQRFVVEYEKIKLHYLSDKNCPLSKQQVKTIKTKRRNTAFKIAVRKLLKLDVKMAIPRLKVSWFYLWH